MPTTDELIRREIEAADERIKQAVERGGLPTEEEAQKLHHDLMDLIEQLERITWRVEGIARSSQGDDVPEVTFEQIGVVAMLSADAEGEIQTLTNMSERLESQMSSLSAIRAEQQFRKR
jgi:hypothetical protein